MCDNTWLGLAIRMIGRLFAWLENRKCRFQIWLWKKKLQKFSNYRRQYVKGFMCDHKHHPELDPQFYWICDKNWEECMIEGQCPMPRVIKPAAKQGEVKLVDIRRAVKKVKDNRRGV